MTESSGQELLKHAWEVSDPRTPLLIWCDWMGEQDAADPWIDHFREVVRTPANLHSISGLAQELGYVMARPLRSSYSRSDMPFVVVHRLAEDKKLRERTALLLATAPRRALYHVNLQWRRPAPMLRIRERREERAQWHLSSVTWIARTTHCTPGTTTVEIVADAAEEIDIPGQNHLFSDRTHQQPERIQALAILASMVLL